MCVCTTLHTHTHLARIRVQEVLEVTRLQYCHTTRHVKTTQPRLCPLFHGTGGVERPNVAARCQEHSSVGPNQAFNELGEPHVTRNLAHLQLFGQVVRDPRSPTLECCDASQAVECLCDFLIHQVPSARLCCCIFPPHSGDPIPSGTNGVVVRVAQKWCTKCKYNGIHLNAVSRVSRMQFLTANPFTLCAFLTLRHCHLHTRLCTRVGGAPGGTLSPVHNTLSFDVGLQQSN